MGFRLDCIATVTLIAGTMLSMAVRDRVSCSLGRGVGVMRVQGHEVAPCTALLHWNLRTMVLATQLSLTGMM